MISLIRGVITAFRAVSGKIARFDASGRSAESFTDREAFQQFGFASGLPNGTSAVLLKNGQNIYLIASENAQYRIAVANGETAIYNQWGDNVVLKKNHAIEVNAEGSAGDIKINAKGLAGTVEVNAEGIGGKVVVNATNVYLGGELLADGVITGMCACAYTGAIHPVKSLHVHAVL